MTYKLVDRVARVFLLMLMVLNVSCGGESAPEAGPPGESPPARYTYSAPTDLADGWVVGTAPANGVNVEALEAMMNQVISGHFDAVDSIAIAHQGVLVLDETVRVNLDHADDWVDNDDLRLHAQFSASKSITSLLVGIAIDQGVFAGTDVAYLDLFDYQSYQNWDARKQDITLHHVLAMQLGLDWDEWDPPYTSEANQLNKLYETGVDYSKHLLDLPLVNEPGTSFAYNTAATISLGQAIENRAPLTLIDYAIDNLFAPLSITQVEARTTPTGLPNGGGGLFLTSRDMVKFGQLLLDNGEWSGEQVVSATWLETMVEPRTEISWSNPEERPWKLSGYAYQWWTGYYESGGQRFETVTAWGFGGQWVVAIPSLELVVAVNSHGYDGSDEALDQAHLLIRDFIIPATH